MIAIILIAAGIVAILAGIVLFYFAQKKMATAQDLLEQSSEKWKNAKRNIENERREAFLKIKDELYTKRKEFDFELKQEKIEQDRLRDKMNLKYEALAKKELRLDDIRLELQQKEREVLKMNDNVRGNEQKLKALYDDLISKLEQLSNMTREDAKRALTATLEDEVKHVSEKWIQKIEQEARDSAKLRAAEITVSAMQRYTADQVGPHSSSIVHLPNDEMKGRIIGKEGRNIKSLEMATGMEFVIGETPEIITISGFNPIRREIARRTLEKLIVDGRINICRIIAWIISGCFTSWNKQIDQ